MENHLLYKGIRFRASPRGEDEVMGVCQGRLIPENINKNYFI